MLVISSNRLQKYTINLKHANKRWKKLQINQQRSINRLLRNALLAWKEALVIYQTRRVWSAKSPSLHCKVAEFGLQSRRVCKTNDIFLAVNEA